MKDLTGITDTIEALKQETRILFADIAESHLQTMPGLSELLQHVESAGLPKAVATSSPRDYMENLLGRFDLLHRFEFALTAEDVTPGKPHPEIYLTVAQRIGVEPEQLLVLEDSETGTRSAAAAGAMTVAIPNEHTEAGDFSMANLVAQSLNAEEILRLVTG